VRSTDRLSTPSPDAGVRGRENPSPSGPGLRTLQIVGALGSLFMGAGAWFTGALPVSGSDHLGWPIRPDGPGPVLAVVGVDAGLLIVVWAWWQLGGMLRASATSLPATSLPALVRTAVAWGMPLVLAPPLYSRDVYSYVVQGAMQRDGVDPYRFGAADYAGELASNVADYWQHSTAPYGPVFLRMAAVSVRVTGSDVVWGVLVLRLAMLAALVLTGVLVVRLARRHGGDPASALWLGVLNPLVLCHVVSGAHNDVLLVLLLLVALAAAGAGRPAVAAAVVAVAILVKVTAVVALPFLVPVAAQRLGRGRWPTLARTALVTATCLATTMLVTAVLDGWYGWVSALADTARVHNGLSLSTDLGDLVTWLASGAGRAPDADLTTLLRAGALALAAIVVLVVLWRTWDRPVLGTGLALVTVVALGPVVHPWYVLWGLVPLAAVVGCRPRLERALAVTSVALAFYPMPSGGAPTVQMLMALPAAMLLTGFLRWALLQWTVRSRRPDGAVAAFGPPASSPVA